MTKRQDRSWFIHETHPCRRTCAGSICFLQRVWRDSIHGQVAKGIVTWLVMVASNLFLPLVLALVIGVASTVDAYMVGSALRKGKPVGKWQFFPRA